MYKCNSKVQFVFKKITHSTYPSHHSFQANFDREKHFRKLFVHLIYLDQVAGNTFFKLPRSSFDRTKTTC